MIPEMEKLYDGFVSDSLRILYLYNYFLKLFYKYTICAIYMTFPVIFNLFYFVIQYYLLFLAQKSMLYIF